MVTRALAPVLAVLLAACGTLSAKEPLFSTADQVGAAPIQEGVWIGIGEACPASMLNATTYPNACMPVELRRAPDGAWLLTPRDDLVRNRAPNEARSHTSRVILAPLPNIDGQPLFVAEMRPIQPTPDEDMSYAVIALRDTAPASRFSVLLAIDCEAAIREGDIAGLAVTYTQRDGEKPARVKRALQKPRVRSCVASTQAAVREAAQRAWISDGGAALESVFTRVTP